MPDPSSPSAVTSTPDQSLAALARPGGGFAMMALDQRISLQTMFVAAGRPSADADLDAFRTLVLEAAQGHVSAVLLERGYLGRGGVTRWPADRSSLILAVDDLRQELGAPAQDAGIDTVALEAGPSLGASALKLLMPWMAGADEETHARQTATVRSFVEQAHTAKLPALVEAIVHGGTEAGQRRATPDELLEAAAILSQGADVYKAQVPIHGGDTEADVTALAREMTQVVGIPWVVLSTGVPDARFPDLVAASCRGGASGFLAGRAIWSRAVAGTDEASTRSLLAGSTADLSRLASIVDAEARPWTEAIGR
jgi:sulfofructosephosphate aldolase